MKPNVQLIIDPVQALADEKVNIIIAGLDPGSEVLVRAKMNSLYDIEVVAESHAVFKANKRGIVDVSKEPSLSGTYEGIEPMGLIWSMVLSDVHYPPSTDLHTLISVPPSHISITVEIDGETVAQGTCQRHYRSAEVTVEPVTDRGLYGLLHYLPNQRLRPALIVVGGGEGGVAAARNYAGMLASHGFPSLALGYFKLNDLPPDLFEIPLEYFKQAIDWLRNRQDVTNGKIGVFGHSKGGELALLLGATFPEIQIVVASAPHPYVYEGIASGPVEQRQASSWARNGTPLPFIKFRIDSGETQEYFRVGRLSEMYVKTLLRASQQEIDLATIRVENTQGPIMIIGGADDAYGPQEQYRAAITERLQQSNFGYPFESLLYPGAGHQLIFPYVPTTRLFFVGGTPSKNAAAMENAWSRVLTFLHKHF